MKFDYGICLSPGCLYDFQTLVAGILAILAAIISAGTIWYLAIFKENKLKLRRERLESRKLDYLKVLLAKDLKLLAARARMAQGTIRVVIAAKTMVTDDVRQKTTLKLHPIIDDWKFMSLLSKETLYQIMRLIRTVDDHNFDMARAGGSFGADNFQESIFRRIDQIMNQATQLSEQIS